MHTHELLFYRNRCFLYNNYNIMCFAKYISLAAIDFLCKPPQRRGAGSA